MTKAICPKCSAEFPAKLAGWNCGACLIAHSLVVKIVLTPSGTNRMLTPVTQKGESK